MQTFRTVLEQKIKERRQTLAEFVEYIEIVARENKEAGTSAFATLQLLIAGHGPQGQPLGPLRPATARLLEHIFELACEMRYSRSSVTNANEEHVMNANRMDEPLHAADDNELGSTRCFKPRQGVYRATEREEVQPT